MQSRRDSQIAEYYTNYAGMRYPRNIRTSGKGPSYRTTLLRRTKEEMAHYYIVKHHEGGKWGSSMVGDRLEKSMSSMR